MGRMRRWLSEEEIGGLYKWSLEMFEEYASKEMIKDALEEVVVWREAHSGTYNTDQQIIKGVREVLRDKGVELPFRSGYYRRPSYVK